MPKPFPLEFRRDVVAVARQRDQSIAQVARSFGVSESSPARWLKMADREDGISAVGRPGGPDADTENRELRRRNKQLEQENEILRGDGLLRPRRPPTDVPAGPRPGR